MQTIKADEFVDRYTRILTHVWSSDEFIRRLEEDPREVLAENGLEITPHATLEIVREAAGCSDLGLQIDLWRQGLITGHFVLHVPILPRTDISEVNEAELGDLAGGLGDRWSPERP